MTRLVILPYAYKRLGLSTEYEVAWNEWDGSCMCSKIEKRGVVTIAGDEDFDPDLMDLTKAIRLKYHGDNSAAG